MSAPEIRIDVDGKSVSGAFFERLISLTVSDQEGVRSDTISLEFDDQLPSFANPRRGAKLTASIRNGSGSSFKGSYVIDSVERVAAPYRLSVKGHSADFRQGMKTNKARHWDERSVGDIVKEIAGEHGLVARVSDAVASHVHEWIGQQDETDLHFLERVARRQGALFTIKNGNLLWLERGSGLSATGLALDVDHIGPDVLVPGSCRISETDVGRYGSVQAFYQDKKSAKREPIVVSADPAATAIRTLREAFSSKEEAQISARAHAREASRKLIKTSGQIIGRPGMLAGQPFAYRGVWPGLEGQVFIVETVEHRFTKGQGLVTQYTAKSQVGFDIGGLLPPPGTSSGASDGGGSVVIPPTPGEDPPPTSAGSGVTSVTAAVALGGHRAITADGQYATPDTLDRFVGITVAAVSAGQKAAYRAAGYMIEGSWNWQPDSPLFITGAGILTQAPPVSGALRRIAWAISPTEINIDPFQVIQLS